MRCGGHNVSLHSPLIIHCFYTCTACYLLTLGLICSVLWVNTQEWDSHPPVPLMSGEAPDTCHWPRGVTCHVSQTLVPDKKVSITIHISNPNEMLSFLMKYYQDRLDDNRSWLHDVIISLDSCLNHRHWPSAVSAPPSLSSFWSDVLWGVSQDNQDLSWLFIKVSNLCLTVNDTFCKNMNS